MPVRYPKYIKKQLEKEVIQELIQIVDAHNNPELKDLIKLAHDYANSFGYRYDKIYLKHEYFGPDAPASLVLYGDRLETSKEHSARTAKVIADYKKTLAKRRTEAYKKEQKERKEYERLKRKFG